MQSLARDRLGPAKAMLSARSGSTPAKEALFIAATVVLVADLVLAFGLRQRLAVATHSEGIFDDDLALVFLLTVSALAYYSHRRAKELRHDVARRILVEETIQDALVTERDVSLRLRGLDEAKNAFLTAVSHEVERILENLVANAVRHTPAGTPIVVRVRREGPAVSILVEDEGPGIPEGMRRSIFEPFRQDRPNPHSPGVGIGLSLVSQFAELHGGRAWVEERPGGARASTS